MKRDKFYLYLKNTIKNRKSDAILMGLYLLFTLSSVVYLLVSGLIFNSFYTLILSIIPFAIIFVEWLLKIRIPSILILCFLIVSGGAILGTSYEFYNKFLWFDDFLHTLSGFMFACFGFTIAQLFIGDISTKKNFIGCLFMGFIFSLAVGLVWELFEYGCAALVGPDMQEDTLISSFNSYFLSGTHKEAIEIDNITHTLIFYGNNQQLLLDGYLDIGLYDTLNDMLVCFLGAIAYLILFPISRWKCKSIYKLLCPRIEKGD